MATESHPPDEDTGPFTPEEMARIRDDPATWDYVLNKLLQANDGALTVGRLRAHARRYLAEHNKPKGSRP